MRGVRYPCTLDWYGGSTPEEAIRKTWETVTSEKNQNFPFVRYFCKGNESVPGNGPQVWVRWSKEKDDWEDFTPDAADWWATLASEIRPYSEHKWMEKID